MLCTIITTSHEHGDMAIGAVHPLLIRHVQSHHFTTPLSLKTIDTVLRSPDAA